MRGDYLMRRTCGISANFVPHPTRADARRPLPSWGEAKKSARHSLSERLTRGDVGVGLLDRFIDSLDRALEKWRTGFDDPFVEIVRR